MQTKSVEDNIALIELIKQSDNFQLFSDSELKSLISLSHFREFEPGEVVMKENDFDSWVYIMVKGKLEIIKDGKFVCYLTKSGELFGEMGVVDGSPRSATIRATQQTMVMGIDAAVIDRSLRNNEISLCYIIYRLFSEVLAERLRATTEENIKLKQALSKYSNQLL